MKKIKIFSSVYGKDEIDQSESAPVDVDLTSLRAHYEHLDEQARLKKHLLNYEHFYKLWTEEWYDKFFMPKALIKALPPDVFLENFGSEALQLKSDTVQVLMLVWTIGDLLEKAASAIMEIRGSMMDGLLLDVAGSVSLYSIHKALMPWLKEYAATHKLYITGEYYPGISTMRKDLMAKVEEIGSTKEIIGVTAADSSFLLPRKSQCSFITLGTETGSSEKCEFELHMERCVPCSGRRCLYFQLGGCHMMTEEKK